MPAHDMVYIADWSQNTYTITFDTDGGTFIPTITKKYGESINPTTI
jgi:hypothetical protein